MTQKLLPKFTNDSWSPQYLVFMALPGVTWHYLALPGVTSKLPQMPPTYYRSPPNYHRCLQPTTSVSSLPQNLKQNSIRKVFNSTYLSEHYLPFLLFVITPFLKIWNSTYPNFLVTLQHIFAQHYPNQFQSLVACHYSKLLNFLMQLDKTHCARLQNFTLKITLFN